MIPSPILEAHGAKMPALGYGTLDLGERAAELTAVAIQTGYRHIDTARKYGSEEGVGEGIRASGIKREDLWVTTKVTEDNAREVDFMRSVDTSLEALGLDYVDLLLVHWPSRTVPFSETLGALAKAKRQGLARFIGVSNFTTALLDEAVQACPDQLIVNQLELHAYLNQDKLLAACQRHGMIYTAYAPIARGELLKEPALAEIAEAKGKTPAQVALRYVLQHPGVAAVPRSLEPQHVKENFDVFDFSLSDDEMNRLRELRHRNVRIADPEVRRPVWDVP